VRRRGTFAAFIDDSAPDDPPRRRSETAAEAAAAERTDLAVVFVIESSTDHLDAAKQLVRRTVAQLAPNDYTAVVAVGSDAQVWVRPTRAVNRARIDDSLSRLQRGGGTFMFAGLKEAFEQIQGINATTKLIVLLTDGDGPEDGIGELVSDFRASRIGMITVGMDRANSGQLTRIADYADGRVYFLDAPPPFKSVFERARSSAASSWVPEPTWLSVLLLIDRSAATAGTKLAAVKRLIAKIDATIWGDDLIAMLAFHDEVDYVLKPSFAGDPRILKARKKLEPAAGASDLAAALAETVDYMEPSPNRRIVVLVTDGAKTSDALDEAMRAVRTTNILLIVVGTPDADRAAVGQLALEMGAAKQFRLDAAIDGHDVAQWIYDEHYLPAAKRANARWTIGSARSASPPPP
jgi:Mg-chelatase subunit ChlD